MSTDSRFDSRQLQLPRVSAHRLLPDGSYRHGTDPTLLVTRARNLRVHNVIALSSAAPALPEHKDDEEADLIAYQVRNPVQTVKCGKHGMARFVVLLTDYFADTFVSSDRLTPLPRRQIRMSFPQSRLLLVPNISRKRYFVTEISDDGYLSCLTDDDACEVIERHVQVRDGQQLRILADGLEEGKDFWIEVDEWRDLKVLYDFEEEE